MRLYMRGFPFARNDLRWKDATRGSDDYHHQIVEYVNERRFRVRMCLAGVIDSFPTHHWPVTRKFVHGYSGDKRLDGAACPGA